LATAEFLIEQIKERTALLGYDDLDDFAEDSPFSPPINSNGEGLNDFAAFNQQVTVVNVSASDFEQADPNSDFVRVTVKVFLNSKQVSTTSWIRAQY
jgi:hypothetical protein